MRLLACGRIPPRRGEPEDRPRDDFRRNQGRFLAGRGPAWHWIQRGAWAAAHPGGQTASRRAIAERPEWARWSDRKIAEAAKVDHKTVGTIRKELSGEFPTAGKKSNGEFPTVNGKPYSRASLLGDVIKTIPDDVLVTECRRRGLTVEADNA